MKQTHDLAVVGGTVYFDGQVVPASVVVDDGQVVDIAPPDEAIVAERVVDARGLHVLPGLVDPHVHTRHPGVRAREDFRSGTAAAAAGGITTLFEMPISKTPANSAANVRARAEAMAPEALIDFALYGGAGHENVDEIAGQAEAGVIAFKTFLQPPPEARVDEFRGLWCTEAARLREVMTAVRRTGLRHCFHCEEPGMYVPLQARLQSLNRITGRAHAESRPAMVEEVSVAMTLALAFECSEKMGIVHCSSARSASLAAEARADGLDVTVEVCTPYLFFTIDDLDRVGPYAKCNPPLRSWEEQRELWNAINDGLVQYLGTDHSPFLKADKEIGQRDIFAAPPGIAGLEMFGPLLLSAVARGQIGLIRMASVASTDAARTFGLRRKGRIRLGYDADLLLADLKASWRFDASKSVTKSAANMQLYDGYQLQGRVVGTIVRGREVYRDGQVVGTPGYGRWLTPANSGTPPEGTYP